jgi:hypothetical protein
LKPAVRVVPATAKVPAWAEPGTVIPFCRVSPPPFVPQLVVLPYSRSPLPARFAGVAMQAEALQNAVAQFASVVQVVPQTAPEQAYGAHDEVAPALQTPAPLQVDAALSVEPVHPAARQTVPEAHLRQAPAPSQEPSSPQVD